MSPRPKTDRVPRALRLLRDDDALLVAEAKRRGLSIPDTIALAIRQLAAQTAPLVQPPSTNREGHQPGWSAGVSTIADRRDVEPRFKTKTKP